MEAPLLKREASLEKLPNQTLSVTAPNEDSPTWEELIEEGKRQEEAGDFLSAARSYFSALKQMEALEHRHAERTAESTEAEAKAKLNERLASLCREREWGPMAELIALPDRERVAALQAMEHSRQFLADGLLKAATEECYIGIAAAPSYLPLQIRLADVYESQGDHAAAAVKYANVIEVYRLRGEFRRAMQVCEKRLTAVSSEEQTVLLRAMRQIRETSPDDEQLRTVLAQTYFRLGRIEQAVEEFAELAALHESRGEWAQTVPLYQAMLQLAPDDLERRERLCRAYLHAGLETEASEELETLAEDQLRCGLESRATANLRLALEHCRKGDQRRALRLREKLVKLDPHDAQLHRDLIAAYLKAGRASQALAEARHWAESSLDGGTPEEAVQALTQVLQLDPWNAEARRKLQALKATPDGAADQP